MKVIDAIENFRNNREVKDDMKENIIDHTKSYSTTTSQLQTTVSELSERVNFLESLLTEVSKIGDTLKTQSINSEKIENPETLKELGEKLSAMKPAMSNAGVTSTTA